MADKKPKKTKYVPTFKHLCDDFVIKDPEGNEYYPHADEWVVFRTDLPWGLVRPVPDDQFAQNLLDVLIRQIRDWNWTDEDGNPYPKPKEDPTGFAWALIDLSGNERLYLRDHCWEQAKLGEAKSSES